MFVIISKGNKKKIISFALLISIVMAVFSNTAITTAVKAETLDETTEEVTLSEVDVPELLSYNDAVANGHTARQYYSEPDLYTAVFANSDGSYTYYNFSEPIKYVGSDGNIYDKRSELTYTRGKYITEQNDVAVEISPDAASGAVLAVGNSSITIVPQFVADNTVQPVKTKKNTLTHRGIANGISISNVALINGMTTEVVIDNKTVDCLDFQVEAENLSLTRSDNNTFIDSTGEVSYRIITPSVIDANGKYLICDNSSLSFYSEGLYTFSVDFSDFFESNDNIEYPLRMTLSAVTETVTNKAFQAVNFYSDPDFSSSTDYMKLGYVGFNQGIICGRTQLKHVNFGTNFLLNNDCEIVEANINLYCTYKALMTGMSVQMRMLADNPSSFSDITYNTELSAINVTDVTADSYVEFDYTDYLAYLRRYPSNAEIGVLLSTAEGPGYSVTFVSPSGNSERRPYLSFTFRHVVNKDITYGYYLIKSPSNGQGITYSSGSVQFDTYSYNNVNQRFLISLYNEEEATYTIKQETGGKYLGVNVTGGVIFSGNISNNPGILQLWHIVKLYDGTVQFWSKGLHGGALSYTESGNNTVFTLTIYTNDSNTKWQLPTYRKWYSQVDSSGYCMNFHSSVPDSCNYGYCSSANCNDGKCSCKNWDSTNLNRVYFNGYSKYIMQDNTEDIMNKGCAICSAAMVLRNLGVTMQGADYRKEEVFFSQLWADPFSVIMANCKVDSNTIAQPNSENKLYLQRQTTDHPANVHWNNIGTEFSVSWSQQTDITSSNVKSRIQTALSTHPEGVCVKFSNSTNSHMVVFYEYDSSVDDFIIGDPCAKKAYSTNNDEKGNLVYFKESRSYNKGWRLSNVAYILTFSIQDNNS